IYDLLDRIEPLSEDQQSWRPVNELYFWPLGTALLLSVLIALATAYRGRITTALSTEAPHA
ncbi:MAG: hypothetical protein L3J88_11710, partial [Gammaproteobacteria bacterium]|nr:hypothetical protein [Gammaproteobacteria bacterium]